MVDFTEKDALQDAAIRKARAELQEANKVFAAEMTNLKAAVATASDLGTVMGTVKNVERLLDALDARVKALETLLEPVNTVVAWVHGFQRH